MSRSEYQTKVNNTIGVGVCMCMCVCTYVCMYIKRIIKMNSVNRSVRFSSGFTEEKKINTECKIHLYQTHFFQIKFSFGIRN
jgi:hypothetical protein